MLAPIIWILFLSTSAAQKLLRLYDFNPEQQAQIINEHNRLRRLEPAANMQEMVWDDDLAAFARKHAKRCSAFHSATATRRNTMGIDYIGENMWWSNEQHARTDLESIIKDFYIEKSDYEFAGAFCPPGKICGHYVQVVWAKTCSVGCALSYCDDIRYGLGVKKGHIYICNYGPGGNRLGKQPYKIGPSCSECEAGAACNQGLCEPQCEGRRFGKVGNSGAVTDNSNRCTKAHPFCDFWAGAGECGSNPSYMNKDCFLSCFPHLC